MAERLPFFTLFESFQAPRQLRLLLHDAYVTGGALDREARTIEVQAVSSETVPEAAVTSLEHMLAQQYDLRRYSCGSARRLLPERAAATCSTARRSRDAWCRWGS